jgi:TBC1 domain family protein 5
MSRSSGQDRSGTPPGHSRQQSSPQLGLPEMITRGLLERGESLGINKTLLNAVTELRVCLWALYLHNSPWMTT